VSRWRAGSDGGKHLSAVGQWVFWLQHVSETGTAHSCGPRQTHHHAASLITANARAWSHAVAWESRCVVSLIAVMDQCSALVAAFRSPVCSWFHSARQDGEQNRACSRRGTNEVPHFHRPGIQPPPLPSTASAGAALPVSAIGPVTNRRARRYRARPGIIDLTGIGFP
jgi:hypothetical protein